MMHVLVTGYDGYIGSVMVPLLQDAGHIVSGLDTCYFSDGAAASHLQKALHKDIRDVTEADLQGYDAIIHLAALSNDPMGELNPAWTEEINYLATVHLARLAREAGVQRFLYASSCSVYGMASEDAVATESSPLRPLTAYAVSKIRSEEALAELADEHFSPVFMRNATAYGWSPRFRSDLVVNNLTAWAFTTGKIRILSDGTPWRPLVHIEDISRAFCAALSAPRDAIHNQAFNVGRNGENYQIRQVAEIVHKVLPQCEVVIEGMDRPPDPRSYRVDFSKIARALPEFHPQWDVKQGVEELVRAYDQVGLTEDDFNGSRYVRLARLKELIQTDRLDDSLRWRS